MNDRIKELRKDLNLTQKDFAEKIRVAPNSIARYELGDRKPSDAIINSICREFNVNEEWLRTGLGDKYNTNQTTDYLYGKAMAKNNEFQMRLLNAILQLDDSELDIIEKLVEKLQKK